MSKPIPVKVTRYQCPDCGKSYASRSGCVGHIGRCWYNPAAQGCKTCVHFNRADSHDPETGYPGFPEHCDVGVSLEGRPACAACGGYGWTDTSAGGERPCNSDTTTCHVGDGSAVKPGPITGCPSWAPEDSPALPAS